VGVNTTVTLVDHLRQQVAKGQRAHDPAVEELLKEELRALFGHPPADDSR